MFPKFDKVINDDPQPSGSTSANTCINAMLADVPTDILIEWCISNLSLKHRRKILTGHKFKDGKKDGRNNLHLAKKAYLYDLTGEKISEFDSISKISDFIGCKRETVVSAYRRKRPLYKMYWVSTNSDYDGPMV